MPSLRQKVTTYFRQLSFIADGSGGGGNGSSHRGTSRRRVDDDAEDDGNFIIKYLEGRMERQFSAGPDIINGQNPTDMPDLKIGTYATGPHTITAACTGPDEGLTGIKRSKLHLSASYADDIDFIDTIQETDSYEVRKSTGTGSNQTATSATQRSKLTRTQSTGARRLSATPSGAASNDANANKSQQQQNGIRSRKNSKTSKELTTGTPKYGGASKTSAEANSNKSTTIVVSMVSSSNKALEDDAANDQNNKNLLNAKTEKGSAAQSKEVNDIKDTNGTEPHKLLETATERLLREAVSNKDGGGHVEQLPADAIAGVSNWKMENDCAYGISVSLYENNMLTKESIGNPIADCYGMVVRGDAAAMALADGVNWGDGARLAARSAVHGCLDYLDRAIFGLAHECMATNTQEVFVSLLRSLWEGHGCILEVGGALSTLTIAVVLPLSSVEHPEHEGKYIVCACNVGDSLGYVYSKQHGVREFTQASHDITSMRDMRDALGALGPADGNKPELSNLTFSMTLIERGDIVFLTSDGISDNFDPVVGKFAEAWTPDVKLQTSNVGAPYGGSTALAPKRQNKSASSIYARLHRTDGASPSPVARPPRTKKLQQQQQPIAPSRPKYMRSQTVIEPTPRRLSSAGNPAQHLIGIVSPQPLKRIPKSVAGLPLVTGPQRHALTLYRLEDLLSYGINGTFSPCITARRLCHLLIDFVRMITCARRKTLEQRELFYKLSTGPDGVKREVAMNRMQHRAARKRIVDSSAFTALPGKLDHATVVAYVVGTNNTGNSSAQQGASLQSKEFQETNF